MDRKRLTVLPSLVLVFAVCAPVPAADRAETLAEEVKALDRVAWYGVYFQGARKCGFAKMVVDADKLDERAVYRFRMLMDVRVRMGAAVQSIHTDQVRYYRDTGELVRVDTVSRTALGEVVSRGEVKGDKLVLATTLAGRTSTQEFPVPAESLLTVVGSRRLVRSGEIGGTIETVVFEPSMGRALTAASKLVRFEDRLLGGVKTQIGVVETSLVELGMKSTEYVTTDGNLIETVVGGLFTLRREPEATAKDVRLAFDAMRAGIIAVQTPLGKPQQVTTLKLRLSGIRLKDLLIDDERQTYERGGEGEKAVHVVTLKAARAPENRPTLPLRFGPEDKEVLEYLKPSTYVQSDAPEMVQAARKIIGDERDPFGAAAKIQNWVCRNVKKKGLAALSHALGVLQKLEGDCSEHSVLFVALCRAAGIPARQVVGIGYSDSMKGFGYHAWAEVYVGEWVAMDPTWGQDLADATHVKFAIGEADSMGVVAGLFGSLKIDVLEFGTDKAGASPAP